MKNAPTYQCRTITRMFGKVQIPRTNIQRNSRATTSNFRSLVLEHSLVLGCWNLDVSQPDSNQKSEPPPSRPTPRIPRLLPAIASYCQPLPTIARTQNSPLTTQNSLKSSLASPSPSTALKVNKAKSMQKNPAIFSGHFDGKTLGNQAKTIQKYPQTCPNYPATFDVFFPRQLVNKS